MSNSTYLKSLFFKQILIVCVLILYAFTSNANDKTSKEYLIEIKKIDPKQIDSILAIANDALIHFKSEKDNLNYYRINAEMSILLSRYSYFSLSEKYSLEALKASEKLKDKKYQVKSLNSYGVLWGRKGDLQTAETYFLKALLLAKKIKDREGMASSYLKLGTLRIKTNQSQEALNFYNKIDSINKIGKTDYFVQDQLSNKAIVYAMQGKLDTALTLFNLGYQDAVKRNLIEDQVSGLQNIGLVYKEMGDLNRAEIILNNGVAIASKNHLEENKLRIAVNLSQIYLAQKKYEAAISYSNFLLKEATSLELEDVQFEIRDILVAAYKKQNNLKEVIKQFEALDKLKSKKYREDKEKTVSEASAELELYKVKEEMKSNENLLFKTTKERNMMLIISCIIGLLLFGLIYSYWNIKKLNARLNKNKVQLTESNETKNKLFTIIGHDLRSAYSSTLGVLGLIKTGDLDKEEQLLYVDSVMHQSEAALATLDDLLLWGNALIKGVKSSKSNLNVRKEFEKNIEFSNDNLKAKNINIENQIPENCEIKIHANHFAFIIRNLIANAVKFTPEGGTVKISVNDFAKNKVQINVIDNGIGIAPDRIDKIFSPDSKSTQGTNNEKGTGLGLTLCREFVEANGGKIWAENNPDKGSSICFTCEKA